MAENSKIEWTHHTFNPVTGCQKVGPGCDNCYAEGWAKRSGLVKWGPGEERRKTSAAYWKQPLKWDRDAAMAGERRRVFCASLADVFDNAWPEGVRADLWALIRATPHLDWMLLTKRPGNIAKMLPTDWGRGYPNVWLGCTVVNQAEADRDIPKLLAVPAVVRFLSMEPLLGPVDLGHLIYEPCPSSLDGISMDPETGAYDCCHRCDYTGFSDKVGIHLVIVGGESGHGARPMHPIWPRLLLEQCKAAGVAFHFKQWGEWFPYGHIDADGHQNSRTRGEKPGLWHEWPEGLGFSVKIGKEQAGRRLDGQTWDQMPDPRRP